MAEPLRWTTALLATAASLCLVGQWSHPVAEVGDQAPVVVEDRLEPTDFSPEELKLLQRRFGVHGPQTQLAQLFTSGMDQLQPLRASTLDRLRELKPVILRQAAAHQVNPMLITAVLFDEIQHSKPGMPRRSPPSPISTTENWITQHGCWATCRTLNCTG